MKTDIQSPHSLIREEVIEEWIRIRRNPYRKDKKLVTLHEGEEKDTHGLKSKEKDVKKDGVVPFKKRKNNYVLKNYGWD